MIQMTMNRTATETAEIAEKYLSFTLGAEQYGVGIQQVNEIIGLVPVTPVPRTPAFVKGIINLRGRVVPVIDLRTKFGMRAADAPNRCIVILSINDIEVGVIVDAVSDVLRIPTTDVSEVPQFGTDVDTRFLSGIGKHGEQIVLLLDADRLLSNRELEAIRQ